MRELKDKVFDLIHEEVSNHLEGLADLLTSTKVEAMKKLGEENYDYDIENITDEIFHEIHGILMNRVIQEIQLDHGK